jgi:hypothetical protein
MEIANKELTIFDIDDTLFETTAKINVMKDSKVIKSLTTQEFNQNTLGKDETYVFDQFQDSEIFFNESKPIPHMIELCNSYVEKYRYDQTSQLIMVTSRSNFNDKEKFLETFYRHSIDVSIIRIERAGRLHQVFCPAFRKVIIIRNCINANDFETITFYDDSLVNLKAFLKLGKEYPNKIFRAILVKEKELIDVITDN